MPASSEKIGARLITCTPRILRASKPHANPGMCHPELYKTVWTSGGELDSHAAKHSLATFISSPADFNGGNRIQRSMGEHR